MDAFIAPFILAVWMEALFGLYRALLGSIGNQRTFINAASCFSGSNSPHRSRSTDYSIIHARLKQCALPSKTWFFGPISVCLQTASPSFQPFLQSSPVCKTDRHTDNETYDILSNSPRREVHAILAMRANKSAI